MRKNIILYALLATMLGTTLVSCQNDDTDMDEIIAMYQVEPAAVELDFSELTELPDVPVTDEADSAYNDYVENSPWNKVINITFDGEAVAVSGIRQPESDIAATAVGTSPAGQSKCSLSVAGTGYTRGATAATVFMP